jgi:hypothetical protein
LEIQKIASSNGILRAMSASLANDIQFVMRLRMFEEDEAAYRYIRDKIRIELEVSMQHDIEIAQDKRRKLDQYKE